MIRIYKNNEPSGLKAYKQDMKAQNLKMTYEDENAFVNYRNYQHEIGKDENGNPITEDAFMELRKSLLKEQKYICCYCGKRIESVVNENGMPQMKTEHFYPKKAKKEKFGKDKVQEWSDLQLEHGNLLAACLGNQNSKNDKHCDSKKLDAPLFGILNPSTDSFRPLFRYLVKEKEKKVVIKVTKNYVNKELLEEEIDEVLNLNSTMLQEQRFSCWKQLTSKELGEEKTWKRNKVETLLRQYEPTKMSKLLPFHGFIIDYLAQWLEKY